MDKDKTLNEGHPELKAHDGTKGPKKPGFISRVTAFHYAARQAKNLKRRASFPLLRQLLRDEATAQKTLVPYSDVRSELLQRTALGHQYLAIFFGFIALWAALMVIRGIYYLVASGDWLNNWLIMGMPLLVLGGVRCFISLKVQSGCLAELHARNGEAPESTQSRGASHVK